jgi:sugar lactone lactonase YvrE
MSYSTFNSGLSNPTGLAFDKSGYLYVANSGIGEIGKISPSGVYSTFYSGLSSPIGLTFDSSRNLYVTLDIIGEIGKITPGGVYSSFCSGLSNPAGLAFDSSGYLYVANNGIGEIGKISPSGVYSQFCSGLSFPIGLAFDSSGYLYVTNSGIGEIGKINPSGIYSTFNNDSSVYLPIGLAFDSSGYLYVTNGGNNTIVKINPDGTINTIFNPGLSNPQGLEFDSLGNLYVANYGGNTIGKITFPHTFTFYNLILTTSGTNSLTIFDETLQKTVATGIIIEISSICFKEGTYILCYKTNHKSRNPEIYIPIEKITNNMYVKTYKHGYKRVKYIIKGTIQNSSRKTINKLYKLSKYKRSELFEDLYITGSHAILYERLSRKQQDRMKTLIETFQLKEDVYPLQIDDKHKLIAAFDEMFEEVNNEKTYNIYHLILDGEKENSTYGIYANGILTESTDFLSLIKNNGLKIINNGHKKISRIK